MLEKKQVIKLLVFSFLLFYAFASYHVTSTEQDGLWVHLLPLVPSGLLFLVVTKSLSVSVKVLFALIVGCTIWFISINQKCFSCLYLLQYSAIMVAFMTWFGQSLLPNKQALCTQFSTHIHDIVSERLARYTYSVTVGWTVFFLLMLVTSFVLYTAVSIEAWSFFTYFLTAPFVGLMFLGEYIIRKQMLPASEALDFMSAIRAYQLYAQAHLHE
jgi:uncharacterized membrane protein